MFAQLLAVETTKYAITKGVSPMSIDMFYGLLGAVMLSVLQGCSIALAYDGPPHHHHHYYGHWGR